MPTDRILIDSLELSACIGVPDDERATTQRLTVNLVLEPIGDFTALDDAIENTVDYFHVCEEVKALTLARPRRLLETLAEDLATMLLDHFPLQSVGLELRKYILHDTAFVAVAVHRQRAAT
ncbi:MAG: dihydroneopterin aldolase [Chthoniobacter sp.]|nr:dihydroneopterin aldolase [Chthoniobacter sp.]